MTFTSHKSQISAPRVTNTWTKGGFCGKTYFFKQVFILNSSGSPRRLKQFWCDFPQASLVVLPIWQNTKVNRETIIINGKLNRIKKKKNEKDLPIYLSSRSSARCLLSGLFVFYSLTAMIFLREILFQIYQDMVQPTLFKQAFSSCPLRKLRIQMVNWAKWRAVC